MKLAKALKFILTLSLVLFTLSSKSDKKVQILKRRLKNDFHKFDIGIIFYPNFSRSYLCFLINSLFLR